MNTTRFVHTSTDELGLVTEALASPTRTTMSYSSIPCAHELILDYLEGVEHDSAIRTNFGVTPIRINCRAYGHVATFALLTPLLRATKSSQPLLYAPCLAWGRPAGHQATRTPPARASALRRPEALVLPRGPAPALARRRCQHGAGSRRQWRSSTPCSAGPHCLTSSSHCSHRGTATPMIGTVAPST